MASKLGLLFRVLKIVAMMQFLAAIVIGTPKVPCYFIFGDSNVDSGNNNNLVTQAKANYLPYGIDFPQGATGRFTNGLTSADIIGQLLGFPGFIPPNANATNSQISTGVNYGSGTSGIREETGFTGGDRISLGRQLNNHAAVVYRLRVLQGNKTFTNEYLSKCIYTVTSGTNDYINNYLMPDSYPAGRIYTPDQYAKVLIKQYSKQLRFLYKLGARKIAVFGLSFTGCLPTVTTMFGTSGQCVESVNNKTQLFNDGLKPLIDELNYDLPNASFTFINVRSISPRPAGVNVPCCQVQTSGLCVPNSTPCPDRASVVWFDGFHPTEVINRMLATRSYTTLSPMDASPYNISGLADK